MHGCGSILAQQSLEGSIYFTWQGLNTALTSLYFALSCTEHRLWLLPSSYAYGCGFVYGYAYGYGYGYVCYNYMYHLCMDKIIFFRQPWSSITSLCVEEVIFPM